MVQLKNIINGLKMPRKSPFLHKDITGKYLEQWVSEKFGLNFSVKMFSVLKTKKKKNKNY